MFNSEVFNVYLQGNQEQNIGATTYILSTCRIKIQLNILTDTFCLIDYSFISGRKSRHLVENLGNDNSVIKGALKKIVLIFSKIG
jgi:hypothetical protein